MFRKVFKAEGKKDLLVELPAEYLNQQVEIIAFQVTNEDIVNPAEKADLEEAMKFFDSTYADMSNFKFDRDEANQR